MLAGGATFSLPTRRARSFSGSAGGSHAGRPTLGAQVQCGDGFAAVSNGSTIVFGIQLSRRSESGSGLLARQQWTKSWTTGLVSLAGGQATPTRLGLTPVTGR